MNKRYTDYVKYFGLNSFEIGNKIGDSPSSVTKTYKNLYKKYILKNKDYKGFIKAFIKWIKNRMLKNECLDDGVLLNMKNHFDLYIANGGELKLQKRRKKEHEYNMKVEYGGVDLTEPDKIKDIYSSSIEISEICEDYMAEEQSYKESQKNRFNEIKEILKRMSDSLN